MVECYSLFFFEKSKCWCDLQVLVRIRPISATESTAQGQKRCLVQDSSKALSWIGHPETMFTFDHVACETISQVCSVYYNSSTNLILSKTFNLQLKKYSLQRFQEKLFRVVGLPMVENCMSGYNGCLFAYGQVRLICTRLCPFKNSSACM
jgi:kinesin family protein 15